MDAQELREQFKRHVLPVLNGLDDPQVVNVIADLDMRVDDLWTERRSATDPDTTDVGERLSNRIQRVYALMAQRPDLRPLLRTVYAYGQYIQHHGQTKSPYVLISAAQLFAQELPAVRLMTSLK